ncbi:MAG TPA: branched-chain amino acid ABC transporter substrate-binding protein [Spirochaetia bacterium]|nr:branched-chain amino acid ABC transporter substrate-binding protein [Spirochaetia bacterium]
MTRSLRFSGLILTVLACFSLTVFSGGAKEEAKAVKIAFIGPLTGPNAAVGIGAKNSFELKINEELTKGYPYKIEVLYEDDASDPATGVAAANKVCSDPDVAAAATHWNSPVGLATVHVFHKFGVAQVLWGTIHPDIIYGNDYKEVTRVIPMSKAQNERAAELGVNEFKKKKWVIIHDTTDYGTKNRDELAEAVKSRGGEIIGTFGVTVGQQDFMGVLTKVKDLNPEAIYYGGVVTEAALIRTQAVKLGLDKVLYIGMAGMQSDTFGKIAGAVAEGCFCSSTFDVSKSQVGQAFVKAYNEKYKVPYEQNGPYAYDTAGIILKAIREVGPDRAKVIDTIAGRDYEGVLGLTHFDAKGQSVTGGLTMYVVQDGKWVRWEDSEYKSGVRKLAWQ